MSHEKELEPKEQMTSEFLNSAIDRFEQLAKQPFEDCFRKAIETAQKNNLKEVEEYLNDTKKFIEQFYTYGYVDARLNMLMRLAEENKINPFISGEADV